MVDLRLRAWRALCGAALCALLASPAGAEGRADGTEPAVETGAPRAPKDGGPRRWRVAAEGGLRAHQAPGADTPSVAVFPNGAVLSNFGCALEAGVFWCRVQPFRGGARGYVAADHLEPAPGPDGAIAVGLDDSGRRARKGDFDARAELPCAQEKGQQMGVCAVAVARSGGGDATLVATFPNGFARRLFFAHGAFIRADATMSGNGADIDWRLEAGVHVIRVDDQRFDVPAALILGE